MSHGRSEFSPHLSTLLKEQGANCNKDGMGCLPSPLRRGLNTITEATIRANNRLLKTTNVLLGNFSPLLYGVVMILWEARNRKASGVPPPNTPTRSSSPPGKTPMSDMTLGAPGSRTAAKAL
jgi:hypothetical protein